MPAIVPQIGAAPGIRGFVPGTIDAFALEVLHRWQPRRLVAVNLTEHDLAQVRQICPQTTILACRPRPAGATPDCSGPTPTEFHPLTADRLTRNMIATRNSQTAKYWDTAVRFLQGADELPVLTQRGLQRIKFSTAVLYLGALLASSFVSFLAPTAALAQSGAPQPLRPLAAPHLPGGATEDRGRAAGFQAGPLPSGTPTPPAPRGQTPAPPASGGRGARTAATLRKSAAIDHMNLTVTPINQRPDALTGTVTYVVKDMFTTQNGSWDPTSDLYAVPDWAKTAYYVPEFTKATEQNNLYAAVLDENGQFLPSDTAVHFWSGTAAEMLSSSHQADRPTDQTPGWANLLVYSPTFNPTNGEKGPWCWTPKNLPAEIVCGGGIPSDGSGVSTFVVWQAVTGGSTTPTPTPTDPTTPTPTPTGPTTPTPTDPTTPTPTPTDPTTPTPAPTVERRVGTWILGEQGLNQKLRSIQERPDHPAVNGVMYVIKDVFSTRDGSWDVKDIFGSIDQWARDAYLKPVGAPDWIDDGGGDHHLFGMVLDLDGNRMKNLDFLYWTDGLPCWGIPPTTAMSWAPTAIATRRPKSVPASSISSWIPAATTCRGAGNQDPGAGHRAVCPPK